MEIQFYPLVFISSIHNALKWLSFSKLIPVKFSVQFVHFAAQKIQEVTLKSQTVCLKFDWIKGCFKHFKAMDNLLVEFSYSSLSFESDFFTIKCLHRNDCRADTSLTWENLNRKALKIHKIYFALAYKKHHNTRNLWITLKEIGAIIHEKFKVITNDTSLTQPIHHVAPCNLSRDYMTRLVGVVTWLDYNLLIW